MDSRTQTGTLSIGTGEEHSPVQLLFIDWLSFMASMPNQTLLDKVPAGYKVAFHNTGTMLFHQLWTVSTKAGRPLLSLQAVPRNGYHSPDTVSIKLDNALLYSDDWYKILIDFLIDFEVSCPSVTRVDFAMDSQMIPYGISTAEFAQRLADGDFIKSGKYNITVHKTQGRYIAPASVNMVDKWGTDSSVIPTETTSGGVPVVNCVTLGSHSSLAQFQVYNKSLELSNHLCVNGEFRKQYIFDRWKSEGLDTEKPVWRSELRLSSKADVIEYVAPDGTVQRRKLNLADLDPEHGLKSTILQAFNRWAQIFSFIGRDNSKRTHITREARVKFLSEESKLSFGSHCSQSRGMTKYIKGVINFVSNLFDECQRKGMNKPADGVVQGWTIRFFLEKLYEFSARTDEQVLYETGAALHIPVSKLQTLSQNYIDRLMSVYTDLRHCLTSDSDLKVSIPIETEEVEFTQEDLEWFYHFQNTKF